MSKIHKLAYHEAQKIAAGEVVERPANVVKELIENALDADATSITVFIEDGGKKLIRIVDNGCGMSHEDAYLSFEHHATSKITTVDDLATIATFGFRGEALSSIASVSKVTLVTNDGTTEAGLQLTREGNVHLHEQTVAAPRGTDIAVRELFYNVPARLKFLKKRETEFNQIHTLFQAYSIAYPHLHWSFYSEGSLLHACTPTDDLLQRIAQLGDSHLVRSLTPCTYTGKDGLHIEGALSNNTYARYDRSQIFFFVNQRWVKNQQLSRALLKGYFNTLPPGRFPAAFLFITLKTEDVDINVHPRKEEVLFLHPLTIENALSQMVKENLEQHVRTQLYHTEQKVRAQEPVFARSPATHHEPLFFGANTVESALSPIMHEKSSLPPTLDHSSFSAAAENESPMPLPQEEQQALVAPTTPETSFAQHTILGQLNKTYIVLEHEDGLYLVDQHAAHERIIYERLATRFEDAATVKLLFPIVVSLSSEHMALVLPHLDLLRQVGIDIDQASATEVIIQAAPVHAQAIDYSELVRMVAGWLHESQQFSAADVARHVNEKLRAQIACKAAVKAGDVLTHEQMEQLLNDLAVTNNRFSCPHGRPTGWLLGTYEIEKRFRRKQ